METFLKPLSTKEEQKYLLQLREGDKNARKVLIERNLRLVAHVVKKYSVGETDIEDIMSTGIIGLIKAIDTFKMERNIKLATYASRCIENELLMLFRNDKKLSKEVFFNETIKVDNTGNTVSLIDVIESKDEDVVDRLELEEDIKNMYIYIEQMLSKREKEILYMRYGLKGYKEMTQREISLKYKISRSYVSRIEKKALEKIKGRYVK
jgi:RNA polymerase sporulation-specific sigma factor